MRGAEQLVEARLEGIDISLVAISLTDAPLPKLHEHVNDYRHAFVEVLPGDNPAGLDLRCVVGLPVVLMGHGDDRWLAVLDRLTEFEPGSIAAHGGEYAVRWTKRGGLEEWAS